MAKCPCIVMQVLNDKFLKWRLHCIILKLAFYNIITQSLSAPGFRNKVQQLKMINQKKRAHKRRKQLLRCPSRYRETSMSTCVTCSQSFAKEFSRMFAWLESKIRYRENILFLRLQQKNFPFTFKLANSKIHFHVQKGRNPIVSQGLTVLTG